MTNSSQFRSFAKQVQVDLLALNDAALFHMVQQWVDESSSSRLPPGIPEETHIALGYKSILPETKTLPHLFYDMPEGRNEGSGKWLAPSPQYLRTLITAMDVTSFTQHIITLAYQSLHTAYPEWNEGVTFNAHLANYLRQMKRQDINP